MLQHSMTLYMSTVLIWGSTFYAIRFQLGDVAVEVSIAYRFVLAALLILAYCALRSRRLRFDPRDHAWMALQGLLLFGANYLLVYMATGMLTSGLIALLFSSIIFMNIALAALLFRRPIEPPVVAGALLGLTGIGLVFWPELAKLDTSSTALHGIGLALLGTLVASFGNMVSVRNQAAGLPIVQTNGYGMGYGGLLMALWAAGQGLPFTFDPGAGYVLSLLYLALFGSVLAFGSYLTLLGRIGPARAAYAMVLFPMVALGLSTLFEGYQWTAAAFAGMVLVVIGNVLALAVGRPEKPVTAVTRPSHAGRATPACAD
jgi:drug/metabolite transporter (DMT)-like permease